MLRLFALRACGLPVMAAQGGVRLGALRSGFSTLQQAPRALLRPQPIVSTPVSRALELKELMGQVSQMRIVPPSIAERLEELQDAPEMRADSVLRKRRLKMKKHKLRKRRKAQRALRKKLKKD